MLVDLVYPHELRFNFVGPHDNRENLGIALGLRALGIVRVRVRDLGIGFWVSGYVTS